MSRRIFKRRSGVITGDLLQDPVADIAALRLIAARDVDDGQLILVRDINKLFSFAYGDVTADDGATVIAPTYDTSVGRWKRVEFSGGGSGDFADKWVDVTVIPSGTDIVVDGRTEDDRPDEIRRREVDVQGTLTLDSGVLLTLPEDYHSHFAVHSGGSGPYGNVTDEEIPAAGATNGKGFRVPVGGTVRSMTLQGLVTNINPSGTPQFSLTLWVNGVSLGADYRISVDPAIVGEISEQIDFAIPHVIDVGDTVSARLTSLDATLENLAVLFLLYI
jgi:hypothetical protein